MSSTKRDTRGSAQLWKAIKEAEIQDDVDSVLAMSDAELDAFISSHGGDAAKIRARGEALAKELDARRDRLAWHGDMEKKLADVRAAAAAVRSAPREKLSRADLLERINRARAEPRFTAPVAALFRAKTPEASTDEELQALLDQIALLAVLEDE
jgi:hypothetical protein